MLKYVAIINGVEIASISQDVYRRSNVRTITSKSPNFERDVDAKKWVEDELKKYPKEFYSMRYGLIAFDEDESQNVEEILAILMNSR